MVSKKIHFRATRKTSVSSTYINKSSKKFNILVNGISFNEYFKSTVTSIFLLDKLKTIIDKDYNFEFIVSVCGSGIKSQLTSVISSICKCIIDNSDNPEEIKNKFKKANLLISDSRRHQRYTPGKTGRRKGEPHNKR